ncbi:PREDICTED: uncharacterized protein LOC109126617 [Camelina sativa]|uniref:Uncharacterized protein LOC109126617 n=1 Tax=Camelina sativa TaxID=90675 RepID=A0ABM1QGI2_CAMSA|nr:PREDICTED: uncharacterized protein LOC109126617 [Camelina sativa]
MRVMWKFIIVMYFIALVGSRGTGAATARLRMKNEDIGRRFALHNKLQRGPVPPSQPSLCHNKLKPFSRSKVYYSHTYVACP